MFIRSGALAESPNCQIAWAEKVVASRNGKSTAMPFLSASRAKYTATSGPSAIASPQYRYARQAFTRQDSTKTCARVRGRRERWEMLLLNSGAAPSVELSTRINAICIVNGRSIHRPR